MTVIYRGYRDGDGTARVVIETTAGNRWLPPRSDLIDHSPAGLEWGYDGSGPAQLALALLAHATGDDDLAVRQHHKFRYRVVGDLDSRGWLMTDGDVRGFSRAIEAETVNA